MCAALYLPCNTLHLIVVVMHILFQDTSLEKIFNYLKAIRILEELKFSDVFVFVFGYICVLTIFKVSLKSVSIPVLVHTHLIIYSVITF